MSTLGEYLSQLDAIHGVSGDEARVAAYMKEKLLPLSDECYADPLGNHVFVKRGTHPALKLMLAAHMDEIGFIIHYIDELGYAFITPVGIHDSRMVINQILNVQTKNGPVKAITGGKPAHIVSVEEASRPIPIEQIHLDFGTASLAETLELGVRVGDYVAFDRHGQFLNGGKLFTGKAVDDRAGCALLIEVMRRLQERQLVPTIYAVATVQEEIGIRGAGPAAYGIQPDIGLAIDVTLAGGTPGVEAKKLPIQMGKGPAIKFFDWSLKTFNGNAVPKRLTDRLVETAEQKGIPYQSEVLLHGATDGSKISLSAGGVVTGGISIPSRYIHSATGCIHMDDLEHAVQLVVAFIESVTEPL